MKDKMTKDRKRLSVTAIVLALGLAACQGQPTTDTATDTATDSTGSELSATGDNVVNIYSARHYDVDEVLYDRFTDDTGIEVNILEGKPDELIERIKNEGAQSPADIYMAVDAGRLWRAQEAGIFQPAESEVLKGAVPESLQAPDGEWFGLTSRARLLVYNTANVEPSELSTYEALANPEWKGRVCVRSSGNVYNQSLVGSMVETIGAEATEEWAKGLVANFARQPEGGDVDQIKAVASGLCDVAIVNHYYWARLAKSDDSENVEVISKTGVFFPNQDDRGTHVNVSGMGLVKNAPNAENAIALMEYMVSADAQELFANANNEYPVVPGVEMDPVVAELGEFKVDEVNVSSYGRNNPEVNEIVDRAGWQ